VLTYPDELLAAVHAASSPLPTLPLERVVGLLADLPRDSLGRLSFHDIQARVLEARIRRVRDIQMAAPRPIQDAEARSDPLSRPALSLRPASPLSGRGKVAARLAASVAAMGQAGDADGAARAATQPLPLPPYGSCKLGDVERARAVERLLHSTSHRTANLDDLRKASRAASIAASVTIAR
jgi:hypothetical protein